MSNDPNINLSAGTKPEPVLQYVVREKVDNGIVELRLRGVESSLLRYRETTRFRIDILPFEAFDQLTSDMRTDQPNLNRAIDEFPPEPFNVVEIDVMVLNTQLDQYTLHINIDPLTPANIVHRYSLSGCDAVAATAITKQGNPAMSMYEYTRSRWSKRGDSVQEAPDRDVIGVQQQIGTGNWHLYVYSTNGNDYEYELDGIFRGRLRTDIASIADDISGGA